MLKNKERLRSLEVTLPPEFIKRSPNVSYLKLSGVRNVGATVWGLRFTVECCNFGSLRSSSQMWRECNKIYINMEAQEGSKRCQIHRSWTEGFHGVRSSSLLDASFAPRIISTWPTDAVYAVSISFSCQYLSTHGWSTDLRRLLHELRTFNL